MRITSIIALLVFCSCLCTAQTTEIKYYKSLYGKDEVPISKARYSIATTNEADGTVVVEKKDMVKNTVIFRSANKGDEQVGVWRYSNGKELNYDFALAYGSNCDASRIYFNDDASTGYLAPKLVTGETIYTFFNKNIIYPSVARRGGISGRVELTFEQNDDGTLKDIKVSKSVHVTLDKEAVRLLRMVVLAGRPTINGVSETTCGKIVIAFIME